MDFEFEAPQFFDFLQNDESSFTDDWFDDRLEDDDYLIRRNNAGVVRSEGNTPKSNRVPAAQRKPVRVRADDPASYSSFSAPRLNCPSPQKSARLSSEHHDPTTPSQNTRLQARLSQEGGEKNLQPANFPRSGQRAPRQARKLGSAQKQGRPGSATRQLPPRGGTPKMKAYATTSSLKTTEELELEKIAAMRAEVDKARKLAQDSYKKALSGQGHIPLRSGQPVTMPQGFHFSTDSRLKKSSTAATTSSSSAETVHQFTSTLRSSKAKGKPHQSQPTRPQPFKLSHSKTHASLTKYVSDAEKIANFSKKTPQRFKSVPKLRDREGRSNSSSRAGSSDRNTTRHSPRLTVAQSPALVSRGRSRPVHILSREEEEQIEYEKHQQKQFKAHPVNHRVLQVANLGVPPPSQRQLTVPNEFALSRRRSMSTGDLQAALQAVEDEDHRRFQARPVNTRILQGPTGVKPVEPAPPTVPESPAFSLKNRLRVQKEPAKKEEAPRVPRANPAPHVGIPFQPKKEHKFTVPQPFAVEERSREMLTRRQHKIQQVLEEERKAHEFQASGLPSSSPDQLPPKQPKPATNPDPFDLTVDKRGNEYQKQFQQKLEEERRMMREAANFKASAASVTQKKAFQPQVSTKPLTEIDAFRLNTDLRAASREQYDRHLKQREAELEAMKRQKQEREEREEKAAIARLRKEAVHHATDIKKYKPSVIKPSLLPLTQPQTPKFSQRFALGRHDSQ